MPSPERLFPRRSGRLPFPEFRSPAQLLRFYGISAQINDRKGSGYGNYMLFSIGRQWVDPVLDIPNKDSISRDVIVSTFKAYGLVS